MATIDLNCDLGEGFGAWEMGNDAAMIELATSVNVACGFHAGDADIMRRTVELAKARGVSVGAHPGYRDLHGFGRRPIPGLKSSEIENLIAYQIGALQAIATAAGHKVTHVKAHGALSNVACEDDMTAKAIANGIKAVDPNLIFVVLANSKLVQAGEAANLPMVHEVFADRAYEDDGSLVSRKKPGAVLHDAKEIADRVVRMVQDGAVVSVTGKVIKMRTDTVCIHGDTPGAVEIGRGVRQALKNAGIDVAPFNVNRARTNNKQGGRMVSMYLRRLVSATPVCALILSTGAAQAQQTSGAITLFNNVRVFDGKGTSLSEPTNVLVRGNLIERHFSHADSGRSKRDHDDRRRRRPHADARPDRQSLARDAGAHDPGRIRSVTSVSTISWPAPKRPTR